MYLSGIHGLKPLHEMADTVATDEVQKAVDGAHLLMAA